VTDNHIVYSFWIAHIIQRLNNNFYKKVKRKSFAQHPLGHCSVQYSVTSNQFSRSEAKLPTASGLLSPVLGRERSEQIRVEQELDGVFLFS